MLLKQRINERFRSSETVEKAEVEEKKYNFLYIDGENCHFMDNTTFDQVEIPKSITGEQYKLLKENLEVIISFMEENLSLWSYQIILSVKLSPLTQQ